MDYVVINWPIATFLEECPRLLETRLAIEAQSRTRHYITNPRHRKVWDLVNEALQSQVYPEGIAKWGNTDACDASINTKARIRFLRE